MTVSMHVHGCLRQNGQPSVCVIFVSKLVGCLHAFSHSLVTHYFCQSHFLSGSLPVTRFTHQTESKDDACSVIWMYPGWLYIHVNSRKNQVYIEENNRTWNWRWGTTIALHMHVHDLSGLADMSAGGRAPHLYCKTFRN